MRLLPTSFNAVSWLAPGRGGALALLLATGLASCGSPQPTGSGTSVTLPATAEARDSVKASLATPELDAASTAADSVARSAVTPR